MGVRLVVVDDHRLLAETLAAALVLRGHRVLAIGSPARAVAESVAGRRPEVCLLGVSGPGAPDAFEPLRRLRRERPEIAVVVLGPVGEPGRVAAAFAAGAAGYVRSDERIEVVERAIARVRAGEAAVAVEVLQGAFERVLRPMAEPDDDAVRLLRALTRREVQVLIRITEGQDTTAIAAGMGIAPSTARTHVQRVLMKLGARTRLEATALAVRTGLLERITRN
ncbi:MULTISPECIES: response regulator transcription factor [unclassified Kitasatospora]|uniref:response regulator transcription factor n=1 Tax=unclassified Kitasatospora TaxID=2633591 RepID=UPI00070E7A3D|nr:MULTISPECIES: response regulator transcription factor [unclassified Kitasatospora]KQV23998.1 transcriptional regulator [Kitasatospora sp. Root107]KRB67288.1 transcriptional regulator [Kitasatospora sp. Root187]